MLTTMTYSSTAENTANKIPRPMNSFMIFRLEKQREISDKCPGANHRDISKIVSKWWKELSEKDKQRYVFEADKLKLEHKKLYPDYKFAPKKRIGKKRAYRKRTKDNFCAQDFDNRKKLQELFQQDIDSPSSIDNHNNFNETRQAEYKSRKASCCKKSRVDSDYSNRASSFESLIASIPSPDVSSFRDLSTEPTSYRSSSAFCSEASYCSPLMQSKSNLDDRQQPIVHTSPSMCDTAIEEARTDPVVNYNIYNSYYGLPTEIYPSYSVSGENTPALHCMPPAHHYHTILSHPFYHSTNPTTSPRVLHPDGQYNASAAYPTVLTQPFYYHH